MAKANKKDSKHANYDAGIIEENIADACKDYMRIFSANNNLVRHLPEVFDGLKIGERRILYTMYRLGLYHNKPATKVAYIVGRTMLYHPHGDAAITDTLVKLAQSWSNIQPSVIGIGNFGSPSGEPAAAGRYIEAKLSFYAYKCFFEEFNPNVVKMKPNYLGNDIEPECLPAKYPNALINPGFGIGYGIATSVPAYNFKECCLAAIELIQNPDADIILYPDSPTPSYIIDEGQFPEICRTGKGNFKMRGIMKIDKSTNSIIVSSTPSMVYWESIKSNILNILVDSDNGGKHNILKSIEDESDIGQLRYRLILKDEADPVAAMYAIYKKTDMQKTITVRYKLTENYSDGDYNIKSLLQTWIDFRRETKRCIYARKIVELTERAHILDILILILNKDNAEQTVKIFKKSESAKDTAKALMKTYNISSLQAKTISDMKFSALTKESYRRYVKERDDVLKELKRTEEIMWEPKNIDNIIIEELMEGIELFGTDRQASIITPNNEVLVRNTKHNLVITKNNVIKKLPEHITNYGRIGSGNYITYVLPVSNADIVMVFDSSGKAIKLPISKIANSTLHNEGSPLSDYCNIRGDIISIYPFVDWSYIKKNKIKLPMYIVMITASGLIKKMPIDIFINMRSDVIAMTLKDTNDRVVACKYVIGDADILIYTKLGSFVRFNTSEIPETGRVSSGVMSIDGLNDNDSVAGFIGIDPTAEYVVLTTYDGYCKKVGVDIVDSKTRRSKAGRIMSVGSGDYLVSAVNINDNNVCSVTTKNGELHMVTVNDIPDLPKLSKGKRLPMMTNADKVVSVKPVVIAKATK